MTLPADPFGRSRLPASALDREARVRLLAQARDALDAGQPIPQDAARLLARALATVFDDGGSLDAALGLRPRRGSHRTPARMLRQEARDRIVVEVVEAVGSPSAAARVFAGKSAPPDALRSIVEAERGRLPRSATQVRRIFNARTSSR